MVVSKSYLLPILILSIARISFAQHVTKCGTTTTFTAANQLSTINWPEPSNTNTFCTYVFKAPAGQYLRARISHDLYGTPPTCQYQFVAVSIDNMLNWDGYTKYCGYVSSSNPTIVTSIGNELKLGVYSTYFNSKYVNVTIESLPVQQGNCDCSWNSQAKIINGVDVVKNEFIAHVAFKATVGTFSHAFCGGTIISQYYALTAAHCIANIQTTYGLSKVKMRVGSHNVTAPLASDTVYAEEYALASAVSHENYPSNPDNYDIGLVKTTNYIRFTRGVGPACLPFSYQSYTLNTGTPLTAVGFGSTEYALDAEYDTSSWILKKVVLTVNTSLASDCTKPNIICAQGAKSGYTRGDTCTRDSGGALYAYMKNRYFDFAAISRGVDCGSINSFSFNSYVVPHFNWIKTKTSNTFLCDLS